jgi:hypothetical protein
MLGAAVVLLIVGFVVLFAEGGAGNQSGTGPLPTFPTKTIATEAGPTTSTSNITWKNQPARVVSVSRGFEPYDPELSSGGRPIEQVAFAFRSAAPDYFVCAVVVRHSGRLVGQTQTSFTGPWTAPPSRMDWDAAVDVRAGHTFNGIPSDASVKCHT